MVRAARGGSTCPGRALLRGWTWRGGTGQMLPIGRGCAAFSGEGYLMAPPCSILRSCAPAHPMPTDHSSSDGSGQRQCRRRGGGSVVDVELHAAMALANMAGAVGQPARPVRQQLAASAAQEHEEEEEELASTRLSLELGNVGIQSSPCSSSSSGAGQPAAPPQHLAAAAAAPGHGPRPRHILTEAEKEAKRLRRVLANRESARQTILRRQAIRDELARKVADLASQNENMKKEKDVVLEQYISLKETNKQLKEQVAKTTSKKKPSPTRAAAATAMDIVQPPPAEQLHAAEASPPPTPPQPSFLYSAAPPAVPVSYVWGSWPPCGSGYEHGGNPAGAPPLCLPPGCAWYYPVVAAAAAAAAADPRGSPSSFVQPFQDPRAAAEPPTSGGGGSPGGGTAGEDTDDDPCSLTLAIDADKKSAAAAAAAGANAYQITSSPAAGVGLQVALSGREKAAMAAEARKRRKELTKMKQMHAGGRHGAAGEQC